MLVPVATFTCSINNEMPVYIVCSQNLLLPVSRNPRSQERWPLELVPTFFQVLHVAACSSKIIKSTAYRLCSSYRISARCHTSPLECDLN